ncbi:MAG: hypothetical protein JNK47_03330 [Mesorhizobium sp.]|nr:hypothetical protein [Mesorhizobium sp.]MBL8576234.1 hypothetical protein [Mesorhizobium sp.]
MVIGSAFLFASAAYVAVREATPFFSNEIDPQERWKQVASGEMRAGFSALSQDRLLLDCRAALASVQALLDKERRVAGARACLSASDAVVAGNPASSLGHYIAAYANAILGEEDKLSSHLFRSWAIAPNELWLAALRARLFQEWPNMLGKVQPAVLDSDLRVLGTTEEGKKMLAQWYLSVPASRSVIAGAIDALAEQYRAAFVAELKEQANEMQ